MPRDISASRSCSSSSASSEEDFRDGVVVRPTYVSANARRRVRDALSSPKWRFERRHGYVRPPQRLPCGGQCCVADFGECGDRKCGNYRLGEKTWIVRPDFLDFCVEHIRRALPHDVLQAGIVYCSLGSGQLLFDWQLLERLTLEEGVRLRAVHLIDQDYGGAKKRNSAVRAQRLLAGWYDDQSWDGDRGPCPFRSFLSALDFQRWALRTGEEAHVLMDCDAVGARKRIDVKAFRQAAMRPDGICLVLSNPAKRTAIVKRRGGARGGDDDLHVLEQEVFRRGEWRHLESVSCSRTRSRQRRRRRSRSRKVSRGDARSRRGRTRSRSQRRRR